MYDLKKSRSSACGQIFGIVFIVIWLGVSSFGTWSAWQTGGLIQTLIPALFVAIGLFFLVGLLWRRLTGIKVDKPELTISQRDLRVGETFIVLYAQRFRRASEANHIAVELVFRESATYSRGTDTETVHHEEIVAAHEIPGGLFEVGEEFRQDFSFVIPDGAMHTFASRRNKLRWFVRVQVDLVSWPDLREEYEIQVLPERMW
jgi:hypothetical protein